jgi:hypothetical protein
LLFSELALEIVSDDEGAATSVVDSTCGDSQMDSSYQDYRQIKNDENQS